MIKKNIIGNVPIPPKNNRTICFLNFELVDGESIENDFELVDRTFDEYLGKEHDFSSFVDKYMVGFYDIDSDRFIEHPKAAHWFMNKEYLLVTCNKDSNNEFIYDVGFKAYLGGEYLILKDMVVEFIRNELTTDLEKDGEPFTLMNDPWVFTNDWDCEVSVNPEYEPEPFVVAKCLGRLNEPKLSYTNNIWEQFEGKYMMGVDFARNHSKTAFMIHRPHLTINKKLDEKQIEEFREIWLNQSKGLGEQPKVWVNPDDYLPNEFKDQYTMRPVPDMGDLKKKAIEFIRSADLETHPFVDRESPNEPIWVEDFELMSFMTSWFDENDGDMSACQVAAVNYFAKELNFTPEDDEYFQLISNVDRLPELAEVQ